MVTNLSQVLYNELQTVNNHLCVTCHAMNDYGHSLTSADVYSVLSCRKDIDNFLYAY